MHSSLAYAYIMYMKCLFSVVYKVLYNWIVYLMPTSNFVFQVQDLAVASPATVSRCGMVYVDPDELKWNPYVQTWISGLGAKVVHSVSPSYPDHLE